MLKPFVIPVIHHLDRETTLQQFQLSLASGADGVMLISHNGRDDELLNVAVEAQRANPVFPVGVNLLSMAPLDAAKSALQAKLSWLWSDNMGVSSRGLDETGTSLHNFALMHPEMTLFAGVAFLESDPVAAARQARLAGFVPTTSGFATGQPPSLEKIAAMGEGGALAIASGMTPENIAEYAPHLSHVLVATGISRTEHHLDPARLVSLIKIARRSVIAIADPYEAMADLMASSHIGRVMGMSRVQLVELFKSEHPDPDDFRRVVEANLARTKKILQASGAAKVEMAARPVGWKH